MALSADRHHNATSGLHGLDLDHLVDLAVRRRVPALLTCHQHAEQTIVRSRDDLDQWQHRDCADDQ